MRLSLRSTAKRLLSYSGSIKQGSDNEVMKASSRRCLLNEQSMALTGASPVMCPDLRGVLPCVVFASCMVTWLGLTVGLVWKQGSSCQMNGGSVALLSPRFPPLLQPNAASVDRVCLNDR